MEEHVEPEGGEANDALPTFEDPFTLVKPEFKLIKPPDEPPKNPQHRGLRGARPGMSPRDLFLEGEERRKIFLERLMRGEQPFDAIEAMGLSKWTVSHWRKRFKDFKVEMDSIVSGAKVFTDDGTVQTLDWVGFADFRLKYFKHKTPPHQMFIVQALESAKPGDIVMVLVPPEHGKTTLFEDYACYKLATNPNYRITVGTEAQKLARRIVSRVKNRMEADGPFPQFVRDFGPFTPQKMENRSTRQVWAADYFNVYKRKLSDERDYSMVGIGFSSNIAGSRTDQLHGDDLQSMKTLNQTEKMLDTFRQDWLSRPGETGITTINGTRVGDGDIYEALMEAYDGHDLFKVVRLPAIVTDPVTREKKPLWEHDPATKTGYTMEMLERIRLKVGEDAWSRNYMQKPRAKGLGTFTEDIVDKNKNPLRVIGSELPVSGAPIYIGLDPALGGVNCLMAFQITSEKLYMLDVVEDSGLARNEQIMARLESMVVKLTSMGGRVTDVVIEAMNFQRGLSRDERLKELSERHGFALREHLTGINKYDADIGVPSMVGSFLRSEIDLPWGEDDHTREVTEELRRQLLRWRPGIKGNILRQDQVMALWFVWILWQSRRRTVSDASDKFNAHGLPWKPTNSGLLVPTSGASPFFRG